MRFILYLSIALFGVGNSIKTMSVFNFWQIWYEETYLRPHVQSFQKLSELLQEAAMVEAMKNILKKMFFMNMTVSKEQFIDILQYLTLQEKRIFLESKLTSPLIKEEHYPLEDINRLFQESLDLLCIRTHLKNSTIIVERDLFFKKIPEDLLRSSRKLTVENAMEMLSLIKNYSGYSFERIAGLLYIWFSTKAQIIVKDLETKIARDSLDKKYHLIKFSEEVANLKTMLQIINATTNLDERRYPNILNSVPFYNLAGSYFDNFLASHFAMFSKLSSDIIKKVLFADTPLCLLTMIGYWLYRQKKINFQKIDFIPESKISDMFVCSFFLMDISDFHVAQGMWENDALEASASMVEPFGSGFTFPSASATQLFKKELPPEPKSESVHSNNCCFGWFRPKKIKWWVFERHKVQPIKKSPDQPD